MSSTSRSRRRFAVRSEPSGRLLLRRAAALAVVTCAVAVLGACSGDADPGPVVGATSPTAPVLQPGKPGEPNASLTGDAALPRATAEPKAADVRFMQDMIVHHAQAIVMISLVRESLADPQVEALALRIADEQRPEIDAMARWLRERGESVPPQADNPEARGGSHHAAMPGMATQAQLRELAQARGAEADRLWLQRMIAHHEGALTMVVTQHRDGSDDYVTQLGDEIHVTQSVQIGHMREMLDRLA